jgi:FixJ family two-component response regulator
MASGTQLRAQRPRTALVLVDDEALASAVTELLKELGWETWEVESFRDAKSAVDLYRPGVFIVDPGLHVDLLERFVGRLAMEESAPGIVVLSDLLSAASIADEHNVTFLQEPFDLDDLAKAVEEARQGMGPARIRAAR